MTDQRRVLEGPINRYLLPSTIKLLSLLLMILLALSSAEAKTFPIKHIIVLIQENRTPDNLFGSNPKFERGVDLASSGLNSAGVAVLLGPDALDDCYDLGHSKTDFENTYDNGKMDGADKVPVQTGTGVCNDTPANPQFKYVDNSTGTVQPYFDIASQYGWANRMYSTQQGPSYPGHLFLFSGTSAPETLSLLFASEDPSDGTDSGCLAPADSTVPVIDPSGNETTNPAIYPCLEHPTLGDLLDAAHIAWKYYTPLANSVVTAPTAINHLCVAQKVSGVLTCTGKDYTNGKVSIPQTKVLTDITSCKLPRVSWVVPTAADSDHAGVNAGTGPSWIASVVNQVGNNPACASTGEVYWNDTAILVTWDDWGGWYDHVPPYQIGQSNGWGTGYVYGMRVPLLVVSAYTPKGYVDNKNHDFGSIVRFIETNNKLALIGPGTYADAYADDLQEFFPLASPRPFTSIAAPLNGQHFLQHPAPLVNPDDD